MPKNTGRVPGASSAARFLDADDEPLPAPLIPKPTQAERQYTGQTIIAPEGSPVEGLRLRVYKQWQKDKRIAAGGYWANQTELHREDAHFATYADLHTARGIQGIARPRSSTNDEYSSDDDEDAKHEPSKVPSNEESNWCEEKKGRGASPPDVT